MICLAVKALIYRLPIAVLLLVQMSWLRTVWAKQHLYVLGLYPFTGSWPVGEAVLSASQMAVDHVNANASVLKNYELVLIAKDSGCNGGLGVNAMFKELYDSSTTKLMVLGPGCSLVAEPTAEVLPHWNLIQISYSAASPALSQKDKYPTFFRVCMSGVVINAMIVAFMEYHAWSKMATIHQRRDSFNLVSADLQMMIKNKDIEFLTSETFTDDPTLQLLNIKNRGSRIIFGNFYEPFARKVFCAAGKIGLYGPKYVWLIPGWYQEKWWRVRRAEENIGCTVEEMDDIVDGTFAIDTVDLLYGNPKGNTVSGINAEQYITELGTYMGVDDVQSTFGFGDSAYAYDTVWTAALVIGEAARRLQIKGNRITDFKYNESSIAALLFEIMTEIRFDGITGPVQFASSGDRQGLVSLTQNQNGTDVQVGVCNLGLPDGQQLQLSKDKPIVWKGSLPPVDFVTEIEELQVISLGLFILVAFCASLGILLATTLMAFNITYRNLRIIKMSSPRLNNLVLFGSILVYLSVVFGGIDFGLVSEHLTAAMCKAYMWTFVLGFSMSFGSLFMKTWRVHRIVTTKSVVTNKISDVHLIIKVLLLVLLNAIILTTWEVMDPLIMSRHRKQYLASTTEDIITIPVQISCQSIWYIYWMGALLLTDGILLVFGAFLTWETRQISIPALNDSKQIGTSIYIVAVSAIVIVPVSVVVDIPNIRYFIPAIVVLVSATIVLCLLFIPKIKGRNDVQPMRTFVAPEPSQHVSIMSKANVKMDTSNREESQSRDTTTGT